MDSKQTHQQYTITENDQQVIWREAIFVFDTSALLNFYEFSPTTQGQIFDVVFNGLKGRLWIPFHVKEEYLKDRSATLKKPEVLYRGIEKNLNDLRNQFTQIRDSTKKSDKHPFVDQKIIVDFSQALDSFMGSFKKEIETQVQKIHAYENDDVVLTRFQRAFDVGEPYTYEKRLSIVKEGRERYLNSIPPVYLDSKEKVGVQVYGDLVIWKQIIDFAKEIKRPIVFINDDRKGDWWVEGGKAAVTPRSELIREMKELAGVRFLMYSSERFLQMATRFLGLLVDATTIDDVKSAIENVSEIAINAINLPNGSGLLGETISSF